MTAPSAGFGAAFVLVTAGGCLALIGLLRPLLVRYALARPNARSAHTTPTPQGGGIAVLGALVPAAGLGAGALALGPADVARLWTALGAAVLVGVVGAVDDLRPLPPLPRLVLQLVAVGLAVLALPDGARVLPFLPLSAERLLLVVGGAWFVNLTNFMDGMDWLTVAETVPVAGALSGFWFFGALGPVSGLLALSLLGAILGFAPANRPVARLFLGDVGSLAIGLVVAFCLYDLAGRGGLAAAVLLPLYYIADSGLTLVWRLRRGDRVWEAHRHHFYQVATARGLRVRDVLLRVFAVNVGLALLAGASLLAGTAAAGVAAVAVGAVLVALLLRGFARGRRDAADAEPAAGSTPASRP